MVNLVKGFAMPSKNGVFLNSCFAHCQTERHDTWYAKNSPAVKNKVRQNNGKVLLKVLTQNNHLVHIFVYLKIFFDLIIKKM